MYRCTFIQYFLFGQEKHKLKGQVLCLNGLQVPNLIQQQEPPRILYRQKMSYNKMLQRLRNDYYRKPKAIDAE